MFSYPQKRSPDTILCQIELQRGTQEAGQDKLSLDKEPVKSSSIGCIGLIGKLFFKSNLFTNAIFSFNDEQSGTQVKTYYLKMRRFF